jgi:sulfopyruvate decarboxylase TPP-binding subunit
MAVAHGALTARRVVDELRANGVTHVIWLVDTESRFMYDALTGDPDLTIVPICREGEAMGVALGLQIGGKKPIVVIQNTGFFESGDSIRGIWIDLKLPILTLVGYRGWEGGGPSEDSAATFLEPVIKAWGIPYEIVQTDDEVAKVVPKMYKKSQETPGPVAVLIGGEYGE